MHKRMLCSTLLSSVLLFAQANEATLNNNQANNHICPATEKDVFAGLNPMQQRLLVNLIKQEEEKQHPLALCFAPGTSDEKIAERYAAMPEVAEFRIHPSATRWTTTATDGSGIPRGVPITIRWSFVPDGTSLPGSVGEPVAPSNLKAFLNGIYGSQATWQALFQQVFDRWSELSGVTYVYEPNDDGASFPSSSGVLNVRGDVRIGGHYIDGNSGTLAYNFYPTTGDMVIDTGDNFFTNTSNNSRGFRNVLAHEAGHGLGFEHVCPVQQKKLMEPFVSTAFDGPQHDDILAVHRNYGDNYGNNSTTGTAHNLGTLANTSLTVTNLSIDGSTEVDVFRFSVSAVNKRANVTLTPVGSTYEEGAQVNGTCSSGVETNTTVLRNLGVELIDSNGSTVLASANANPAGQVETFTNITLNGTGPYYIRISSADNIDMVQLYDFTVTISDPSITAPVLAAEPATTPGTQNTISWSTVVGAIANDGSASKTTQSDTVVSLGSGFIQPSSKSGGTDTSIEAAQDFYKPGSGPIVDSTEEIKQGAETAPVWQGILTETFEGVFPGSTWTRSGNPTWDDVSYDRYSGSWSGWCAASTLSPASGYVDNMQSWMIYGPFSLAEATSARVTFFYKNFSESGWDFFKWLASTNGTSFQGFQVSGDQNTWRQQTFDFANAGSLGNLIGQNQVWFAFNFTSDGSISGTNGYTGAFVDDVIIEKDVPTLPELTTHQPANWNDKIPIGVTQLGLNDAHSYNGVYYDHHTLYFNWAAINSGAVTAAGTYTVRAEVTGTGGGSWSWTVTNNAVGQWVGSTLDQAVGPLAAGTHTFKVWIDYNNQITEINESNNYYERTITVGTQVPVQYYAEASTSSSFTSPIGSGWISATQYTFQNLTLGQTYWYRVKARQGVGNESAWSTSVSSTQTATPLLSVGPSNHDFGTIAVGSSADRTFFVTNSGSGTLSGTATVPSPFSIVSGGTYNLNAGQAQSVVVRYSPGSAGAHSANVAFTGGGGANRQVSGAATNAVIVPPTFNSVSKSNGGFQFTLSGQSGQQYVVQYSTNLVQWTTLTTLTNTSGSVTYTDSSATNVTRFYRAYAQ